MRKFLKRIFGIIDICGTITKTTPKNWFYRERGLIDVISSHQRALYYHLFGGPAGDQTARPGKDAGCRAAVLLADADLLRVAGSGGCAGDRGGGGSEPAVLAYAPVHTGVCAAAHGGHGAAAGGLPAETQELEIVDSVGDQPDREPDGILFSGRVLL